MDGCDPNRPFDEVDAVVLRSVRGMWDAVDPMPHELVPMIDFALDLAAPGVEFLRTVVRQDLAGARGEQARLITFAGAEVTVMIDITANADGSVRLDGWITPAASVSVELRTTTKTSSTSSDEGGRFSFETVAHGLAQLHVRTGEGVTTPSVLL